MNQQIQRIHKNHKLFREQNSQILERVFGAGKHKFTLNPVATIEQIRQHEKQYGFEFPLEYKRFILEVGDGGAGPFYGLKERFPASIGISLRENEAKLCNAQSIYTKIISNENKWKERLLGENWEKIEDDNEDLYEQGTLSLCEVGCGEEAILIINGPLKGKVIVTDYGFSPYSLWSPPNFLDFYESWQIAVLSGKNGTGYGF